MCGRYALALSNEEVYDALQNQLPRVFQNRPRWEREQDHRSNYNIAPRQRAPVVRRDNETGQAIIETMQWGLIPHWTKHPPTGGLNTINARSESLVDASSGGMWHALKGYKRCIVPAQGYYEWLKRPSSKIAHFTRLPLTPKTTNANPPVMFFAGLYDVVQYVSPVESKYQPREGDSWEPYPTGNPIPLATFTILTTTPAKDIEWLHDRMPCVLQNEDEIIKWLDLGEMKGWEEGKGGTGSLLKGTSGLDCFPVNPEVGKIGNNSPTFIQPVSERSDGIKSFFQKQGPSPSKAVKAEQKKPKVERTEENDLGSSKMGVGDIKSEITPDDKEEGLGDDSNAPNPAKEEEKPSLKEDNVSDDAEPPGQLNHQASPKSAELSTPSKRKRDDADPVIEQKAEKYTGRQTKVIRRSSGEEANKDQPAITSFFQSPSTKKTAKEPPKGKPQKRGKK